MSSSKAAAKNQARALLRSLCHFMLPLIQGAGSQTMDADEVCFGVEADEFVSELENFISDMISRSRPRSQDIIIEATLGKTRVDSSQGMNSRWEIPASVDEIATSEISGDGMNPEQIPAVQSMIEDHVMSHPMPLRSDDKDLQSHLQSLRRYVTQKMPIRLVFFEPHEGKLKISLLERAEIYNYLASKMQADYNNGLRLSSWNENHATYAILSHTWNQTPGELTYNDWQNGSFNDMQPKYQKLVNFCKAIREDYALTLGWIDTVCINKESSAELDESIRSMYGWYSNSTVCITYLSETTILSDMRNDLWFSRGWTFQELVAPYHIKFYNKAWNQLSNGDALDNDKNDPLILEEIGLATGITPAELADIRSASISRRMQLAAKRQVTREEDIAYCLMGIFDVSISTAYGEGAGRAFFRLVEEIFRSKKDISDIFNWAGDHRDFNWQPTTSLLPSHPSHYSNRVSDQQWRPWHPIEPFTLTHLGLRTPILLMPAMQIHEPVSGVPHPIGSYYATISITTQKTGFESSRFQTPPKNYQVLDEQTIGPKQFQDDRRGTKRKVVMTFGILNVEEGGTSIHIPKTCLAVLLIPKSPMERVSSGVVSRRPSPSYSKKYTEKPIVFDLKKTGNDCDDNEKHYYELERSKMATHGMELVTLYL